MPTKNVVLLRQGHDEECRGDFNADAWLTLVKKQLEEAMSYDRHTKKDIMAANVEVINTLEQLIERLQRGDVSVVISVSRSLIPDLKRLKRQYRLVKMFCCTSHLPNDEIIFVDTRALSVPILQHVFLT